MHTETLSNWARDCARCAAVGMPPLGSSFRHVSSAAGYCGDWETVPLTTFVPFELGSGKSITPPVPAAARRPAAPGAQPRPLSGLWQSYSAGHFGARLGHRGGEASSLS